MRRWAPLVALPVLLLLASFVAPLVTGSETLILRDVLQTHFLDRVSLGRAVRDFEIPLVDPLRAGGQALAGNLNALPFYPDNLLLLAPFASDARATLWALDAHFWLHWFAALVAAFWMARAFGVSAVPAWMGAVAYAFSGYFASQLNLYNTVAAAAWAPAMVAAFLETAPAKAPATRRRGWIATAILWALLLLGGEPLLAALVLVAAASALLAVAGRRAFTARLGLALLSGTLLAAPQIVEMARIVGLSFRNSASFGAPTAIVGSFRLAHLADFVWPFFFGRPSLTESLAPAQFDGYPPLNFTLYPGLLAAALAAAGVLLAGSVGRPSSGQGHAEPDAPRRRAARWGIGAIAVALFLALGSFNPVVRALWELPLGRLFRFPAKFWLLGALGFALLAALGCERTIAQGPRVLRRALLLFAVLHGLFLLVAIAAPAAVSQFVAALLAPSLPAMQIQALVVRMEGLSLLSILFCGVALAPLAIVPRRPALAVGALVFLHAATQLWAMLPALPMDEVEPYVARSPLLARIPAGSVVVHGGNHELFRPGTISQGQYPDSRIQWLFRRSAAELYPFAAVQHGLRAELAISPEGLDSFLTQALTVGLRNFSDRRRLDILEALGVDYLVLDRDLAPESLSLVREVAREVNFGQPVRLYELVDRAHEAEFATEIVEAPQMNAALEALFAASFDPHRTVVVPSGSVRFSPPPNGDRAEAATPATVRMVRNDAEEALFEVEAPVEGVLHLRRAYLALWRVTVDDQPAKTLVAQVAHLGVAVPAGLHRVRFYIDRRSLFLGGVGFALGLLLLALLVRAASPSRRTTPVEAAPK